MGSIFIRLANRAKMAAPLADHQALDWAAANFTGLTSTLVYLEVVLKIAAPIHPINARAVVLDSLL